MKKLLVILSITALVLACGIVENVFVTLHFKEMADDLDTAAACVENEDYAGALVLIDEASKDWEDNKTYIYLVSNHNITRNLYDRVLTARVYTSEEKREDALMALNTAAYFAREMVSDISLHIYNII